VFSLYNDCQWDDKAVRRLVGDGKLAARSKGGEDRTPDINQECPICFLYYMDINVTKCCSAYVCTECFLQVRPQKEKHATCPFCNSHKLTVSVAKKMTAEQLQEQEKEEQQVVEARIRSQSVSETSDGADNSGSECFGSSLKQDSRVALMRARSESFTSNNSGENINQKENIMSLAMTPEERQRLEEEMKAQLSHPLTMRLEAEAEERRIQNDRAFSRISNAGSSRELRAQRAAEVFRRRRRGGRDWNQIVDAFERGGNGEIHSLDDLVVLEAAILLSMDEECRQVRPGEESFDAARHARDGFPLVRSFFANRRDEGLSSESERGSGSRQRQQVLASGGGSSQSHMGNTALDTAAMLMHGISEADQVAMAIAASLQDHNSNNSDNEEENQDDNNESTNNEEDNSDDEEVYHDNDEEGHDNNDDDDDDDEEEEEQNLTSMVESDDGDDGDDDDGDDDDNDNHDDDDDHEMQDTANSGDEDLLNEEANDRTDAESSEDNGPTEVP
jgi:hypothetical protein